MKETKYDYLIIGAGFFGATFARLMTDAGKSCLVIDKRSHIGGNAYSQKVDGIDVHLYGPHIFHTNDDDIWNFVNKFSKFNNFVLSPKVYRDGKMYSLPFNMNTFYEMWGVTTPEQAKQVIDSQKFKGEPSNLEEQALSLVGKDIYETIIRDYTIKQWKKDPKDLPSFIIKRLPLRFTYDNNYFNDKYQGIPENGYDQLFTKMLDGVSVRVDADYFKFKKIWDKIADKVVFTGKIDEYFDYEFGELQYRSLKFEHKEIDFTDNFQGTAIINYPDKKYDYTRIIEHKHFTDAKSKNTIITYEYPMDYKKGDIPYYPINDETNQKIYQKYKNKAKKLPNFIFGGRLSEYRYYDMHQVIASAMKTFKNENL